MNEPYLAPALHHSVQHLQKRHHVTTTNIDVHILDVRSGNPKPFTRLRHDPADHLFVDFTIGKKGGHGNQLLSR